MDFATRTKLPGARAKILSLFSRPESEIQDHVHSQGQGPARHVPLQSFHQTVPAIVVWIFCVLPEETDVPLIDGQSKCRVFMLSARASVVLPEHGSPTIRWRVATSGLRCCVAVLARRGP